MGNPVETPAAREPEKWREVRYRHTSNLPLLLAELRCSLLVSTYQAGKLLAIGTKHAADGSVGLHFSFHNFDQAMGVAVSPTRVAVGAKGQLWLLEGNKAIAPTLERAGQFDRCYLARSAHVTGGIHCHELAWDAAGELWVVNTLFSCLATLHPEFSFVPRWRPPFISELAGEDRCHLNGVAMRNGQPALVTVMAPTNTPAGWRERKESTGCILDVSTGEPVTHALAMPHSPRVYQNRVWVLNSGFGTLEIVDVRSGLRDVVERMPGYTRGLAFCGPIAFVGLSRIRETAVFGGVPIAAQRQELKCGIGVVDLRSGRTIATLEFESGVEEIFDVQALPETRCVAICGPRPDQDGAKDIWIVPRPDQVDALLHGKNPQPAAEQTPAQLVARALELQRDRRTAEAIELFRRAYELQPQSGEILNHLGNALQDAGQQELALETYARAAAVQPTFGPALQNLGYVLVAQGRTDEGVQRLKQAQAAQPADVNHVLIAAALPVIYESVDDLRRRRARLTSEVARLADSGLRIDTTDTLVPTNFFAAYQGENDRELHANLGRIYRGVDLCGDRPVNAAGGKLRVGFLSAYFRDHTIGRLNLGRIEHLPRDAFEVVVLSVGAPQDDFAERFRRAADKYIVLPRQVAVARRMIADEQLDILFFADVGMDALSYTLAFSRMAPVQCTTWGHPVTTGSPTMDCFLSSQLLETADAQDHYTERLIRPPSLATHYFRPKLDGAVRNRSYFNLPADVPLYGCPQTLFKFHPEFDEVLAAVLRLDAAAHLVLIEGRTANWTKQLKDRFSRTMPSVADRIIWLPAQPNDDYLQLLRQIDVLLDPIHFGGGNTTYEALAVGTPVVTLPGPYLRGRITLALYRKMAGDETLDAVGAPVVFTQDQYVQGACQLAARKQRERCCEWIQSQSAVLFEDEREAHDFEQVLAQLPSKRL